MKPAAGDKITDWFGYERVVERYVSDLYDFGARSSVGGWLGFRDDEEGFTWVPADDPEALAAMLATRVMRDISS